MCVDTRKAVLLLRVNVNDTSVFHDEFIQTLNHWKKCSEKYPHVAANSKSGNLSIVTRKKVVGVFGSLKPNVARKCHGFCLSMWSFQLVHAIWLPGASVKD